MRLKSIELLGFKSFAKKARLDFNAPVTGIVGPNGSGKSNVVEAFRFVLGEQSMKSLRGKSGKDLIFKGSKDLAKGSRASVEIVFDNKDKVFKLSDRQDPINLDYEEIALKREVYSDGANNYYINNTPVRLKDIVELLASVNIGASGHHIISQGQADRILSSSAKDRRSMIEDALGLKVYQYKLKDAGKKLEKTAENMKEISSLKRELAPHIRYLKKQVEKIEKGQGLRNELTSLYLKYFNQEDAYLKEEDEFLKTKISQNERSLKEAEVKLKAFSVNQDTGFEDGKTKEIQSLQQEVFSLNRTKDELTRKLGRIEGMIEFQNSQNKGGESSVSLKKDELDSFVNSINSFVQEALKDENLQSIKDRLLNIKNIVDGFGKKFSGGNTSVAPQTNSFKDLEVSKKDLSDQIEGVDSVKKDLEDKIAFLRSEIQNFRNTLLKDQEERFSLETRKNNLENELAVLNTRLLNYKSRKAAFEEEMKEAVVLVGRNILEFQNSSGGEKEDLLDLKKRLDRIKIKLEDIGTGSGEDVMKEYKEVTEREEFLTNELTDLEKSIENLKTLIKDLKETLDREFKEGLADINKRFEEFFSLMFGGGNAYLSTVTQDAKKNNALLDEDEEEMDIGKSEAEMEQGIDINVNLPHKKVKDLHMLSGGERSLTSIALVFAMTQVNPPPFLVLDETDAALDEANSKRYGDMIEKLSKYSQLLTVTHNRETMSRADVIYGVTIGSDGSSKLLSIKFSEAEEYAK